MTLQANARDQKMQAVLHALGYDLGKHGVDGIAGQDTKLAMRHYAISKGLDIHDMEGIRRDITDRLKDPAFRERQLDVLKVGGNSRDNVVATKVLLEAAGHPTLGMKDLATGLMTGKMDSRTQYALEHTVGGHVDTTVIAAALPDKGARDIVIASKNIPNVNDSFAGAAEGANRVAQAAPTLKPVPAQRLDM